MKVQMCTYTLNHIISILVKRGLIRGIERGFLSIDDLNKVATRPLNMTKDQYDQDTLELDLEVNEHQLTNAIEALHHLNDEHDDVDCLCHLITEGL